ncbi:MAG: nitrate ABC transporter substrate-binding protein [Desulfarculus sp.]|nr:MAG: nitrate ABC transporter substrate-binding protein [Desulfarculus sp.]
MSKRFLRLAKWMGMAAGLMLLAGSVIGAAQAPAQAAEPVHITYGYHPYWTGGWSGVVIKQRELWKKYLPKGSTVNFEAHLTGPPMVNALLANKMQVGTMGDMPSLVATTKKKQGDIRLVSVPMISNGQNCNLLVVRKSAPDFKSPQEAIKWMNGKLVAVHRGTCANRFFESVLKKNNVKPGRLQYMTIEVIASSFEAGKLDAAAMWEPHARKVVEQGFAKYVATGSPFGELDANFTLMRQDFIEKHPEAAKGWLKAEIEALQIMQKDPVGVANMVMKETQGYTPNILWKALYERHPDSAGGDDIVYVGEMVFSPKVIDLMKKGYAFLHSIKVLKSPDIPKGAINEGPVKAAMKEMGVSAPVCVIKGMPASAYKGK